MYKLLCVLAVALSMTNTVVYSYDAITEKVLSELSLQDFREYMAEEYGKTYESDSEAELRFDIFANNLNKILEHNSAYLAGLSSYWLSLNAFVDMTNLEFRMMKNNYDFSKKTKTDKTHHSIAGEALPTHVDWRTQGVVTPVKDQGQCGSCWSFACTGSMEGAHAHATGNLVSFSEQALVDCVDRGRDNCAHGGEMQHGFRYAIKHGAERESDYPYEATSGHKCRFKDHDPVATFSSYLNVTQYDEQALKSAVYNYPTVAVAIDASGYQFQFYGGGVYDNPDCKWKVDELDHGVLLVGYGTEDGTDYWIVKNSWGASWGDAGYIKMSRNKNNQCGIATDASFVRV